MKNWTFDEGDFRVLDEAGAYVAEVDTGAGIDIEGINEFADALAAGKANGRLIAAAPKLLAALKQCLTLIERVAAWDDGRAGIEAARAAIAEAEGRA